MNNDVEWPGGRGDVLEALELLSEGPPEFTAKGADPRWPDLTNAVHWLVDDTWWDQSDPAESVGTILRNNEEAAAISEVICVLLGVADRQGATASDAAWFGDPGWPQVRENARQALAILLDGETARD